MFLPCSPYPHCYNPSVPMNTFNSHLTLYPNSDNHKYKCAVQHHGFPHHLVCNILYFLMYFLYIIIVLVTFTNIYLGWGVVKTLGWRISESRNWEEISTVLWCSGEERWWSCLDFVQRTESPGVYYVLSCKDRIHTEYSRRGLYYSVFFKI